MPNGTQKKIIRLLGVGFDAQDGHVRITKGEKYDVFMGSEESHAFIRQLIQDIEEAIKKRNLSLEDLTAEELAELVESLN